MWTFSIIISRALGYDPDPVEEMVRSLAHDTLHVAHEPVHVPLAPRLLDDVLIIVISQTTRKLLIIHFGLVFPKTPPSRDLIGILQFELPPIARPGNDVLKSPL